MNTKMLLGCKKTRFRQAKTRNMWGYLSSSRAEGRIFNTNQLFNTNQGRATMYCATLLRLCWAFFGRLPWEKNISYKFKGEENDDIFLVIFSSISTSINLPCSALVIWVTLTATVLPNVLIFSSWWFPNKLLTYEVI